MATGTGAPLFSPLVLTTAYNTPWVRPDSPVTVNEVAVAALIVLLAAGVKTTLFFPGTVLKLVPVMVRKVPVFTRMPVERVTVGDR